MKFAAESRRLNINTSFAVRATSDGSPSVEAFISRMLVMAYGKATNTRKTSGCKRCNVTAIATRR
ncbi:hypothetical protein SAMN05216364_101736 [Porphyromonadaceae bacterium KHP3R9]|nr:hypothetical protein SAMN05216364_101736 [Porphyromonadaceae bacterium KHP3R9]